MKTVKDRVIEVITNVAVIKEVTGVGQVLSELGFDSLKKVNLIIELENEFNIQFDDSELSPKSLNTVSDLVELAERHMGE